jgi:hypothetical protein
VSVKRRWRIVVEDWFSIVVSDDVGLGVTGCGDRVRGDLSGRTGGRTSRGLNSVEQPMSGSSVPDQPRIGRRAMWTTRRIYRVLCVAHVRVRAFPDGGWRGLVGV